MRIASVSYLNARPLIQDLDRNPAVQLSLAVPAKLIDLLRDGQADVALLPVIDYARLPGLVIIPAGGIASDGETLTVRIFSRVPIPQIRSLASDPDSHTSVALARIILARRHNLRPEFCDLARANETDPHQARLLIGDKVVCAPPGPRGAFDHQLDLGAEWKAMTGLPFVFAVWMARAEVDATKLAGLLTAARLAGMDQIDSIIKQFALPRGWPAELARKYLTHHLEYSIGPRHLEAIERFLRLAAEEGIIPAPRRWSASRTCLPCES